jgi:hypothetical protein
MSAKKVHFVLQFLGKLRIEDMGEKDRSIYKASMEDVRCRAAFPGLPCYCSRFAPICEFNPSAELLVNKVKSGQVLGRRVSNRREA